MTKMKKLIAALLIISLIGVFAACAKDAGKADDTDTTEPQTQEVITDSPSSDVSDEANSDSLNGIVDSIYAVKEAPFKVQTLSVDLTDANAAKAYTGLDDVSAVEEAVASESMMGSQAYSLVLVKVKDSADAEKTANDMLNGINTRKWICVEADDLAVAYNDNIVMLIMMQSDFEDVSSSDIVEAFKTVNGGSVDGELTK